MNKILIAKVVPPMCNFKIKTLKMLIIDKTLKIIYKALHIIENL